MSLTLDPGLFKCHGCGASGDLFTLASLLGMKPREAAEAAYGEGVGTFEALLGRGVAAEESGGGEEARALLTWPPTERAVSWLRRRGLCVNEVGGVEGLPGVWKLPLFAEGKDVLGVTIWCAVLVPEGAGGRVVWEMWRYYRVMLKKRHAKYFSTQGFPRGRVIGVGGEPTEGGEFLYLTEGVFDALALLQAQALRLIPAGPSYFTFGASVARDQIVVLQSILGGRRLVLAYDHDQAGLDCSLGLLRVFSEALVLNYPGQDPGQAVGAEQDERWGTWGLQSGMEWLDRHVEEPT
jgi:hypothetical protein